MPRPKKTESVFTIAYLNDTGDLTAYDGTLDQIAVHMGINKLTPADVICIPGLAVELRQQLVAAPLDASGMPAAPKPNRGGRPRGSKNKPKLNGDADAAEVVS